MNFKLRGSHTVLLMSQREGAPYADRVEEDGRVLIYEGHDIGRGGVDPKSVDQPEVNPDDRLTENGLFLEAVAKYKCGETEPELVKVYEKIRAGIWVYNGIFKLVDAWKEKSNRRDVFKFKLGLLDEYLCVWISWCERPDSNRRIGVKCVCAPAYPHKTTSNDDSDYDANGHESKGSDYSAPTTSFAEELLSA